MGSPDHWWLAGAVIAVCIMDVLRGGGGGGRRVGSLQALTLEYHRST